MEGGMDGVCAVLDSEMADIKGHVIVITIK